MEKEALTPRPVDAAQAIELSLEEFLSDATGLSIRFGGKTLIELRVEGSGEHRRPVLELNATELDLRVRVSQLHVECKGSSLQLAEGAVSISSTGIVRLSGQERLELWGGPESPPPDALQPDTLLTDTCLTDTCLPDAQALSTVPIPAQTSKVGRRHASPGGKR